MIYIDRRQSILLTTSTVFLTVNAAFGQVLNKLLDSGISNAFALQNYAVTASTDKDFAEFVTRDFFARQTTAWDAARSKLFGNAGSAESYLTSIIGASRADSPPNYFSEANIKSQIQAVVFVASANVPLVPDIADILPIGIPSIEPLEKKTEDTDLGVVLDIALQTMGIFESKNLVDELLKDKNVLEQLHMIAPLIKDKDWKTVLHSAEIIFGYILEASIVKEYTKIVGKKLAFRLTLRCVPIVGWAYVAAAFLVAVRANYRRFSFVA